MIPEIVIENLTKARNYYSNLNSEVIDNLKKGCMDCEVKSYTCLKRIITALEDKIELDVYDDVAEKLYTQMMIIIGDYVTQTPPTVDAGSDQTAEIGGTVVFTAVGTAGSSPIVSYLWTQTSGTPATLTNANTASVSVSNYPEGAITLKITVTDENGLTGSDTVQLTGTEASLVGYWWLSDEGDEPLTESEILEQNEFNFADGGSMTVAFTGLTYKVPNIAYPDSQANRTEYVNADNPVDTGDLGTGTDLLNAVVVTGAFKQQNGNYVINGDRTLIFS